MVIEIESSWKIEVTENIQNCCITGLLGGGGMGGVLIKDHPPGRKST